MFSFLRELIVVPISRFVLKYKYMFVQICAGWLCWFCTLVAKPGIPDLDPHHDRCRASQMQEQVAAACVFKASNNGKCRRNKSCRGSKSGRCERLRHCPGVPGGWWSFTMFTIMLRARVYLFIGINKYNGLKCYCDIIFRTK